MIYFILGYDVKGHNRQLMRTRSRTSDLEWDKNRQKREISSLPATLNNQVSSLFKLIVTRKKIYNQKNTGKSMERIICLNYCVVLLNW